MITKLPPALDKEQKIAVLALSSVVEWENFEKSLAAMKLHGVSPLYEEKEIRDEKGYLAGTDEARLERLRKALSDPKVGAIYAARGGYGAMRLLERLRIEEIRRNPKWLVGFSDVTALGMALNKAGLIWLHAPLFTTFHQEPKAVQERTLAFLRNPESFLNNVLLTGEKYIGGKARGTLLGGNLTMLASMNGTPFAPDYAGSIVVIEEVGEEPYRIDRMLTQLSLSKGITEAAGFVVGRLTNCESKNPKSQKAREVLLERLKKIGRPTMVDADVGHESPNYPLPIGAFATLEAGRNRLVLEKYEGRV